MQCRWPPGLLAVCSLQQAINSCAMSSKWEQRLWQLFFICYGDQCLPGDESTANTPPLISQFLPCTLQTGDRQRAELLSVKSSTVTTDRPSSPRQLTPSEVCLIIEYQSNKTTCSTHVQTVLFIISVWFVNGVSFNVKTPLIPLILSLIHRWRMRPAHHPGPNLATQARSAFALPVTGD